jgi:hypothetical protein
MLPSHTTVYRYVKEIFNLKLAKGDKDPLKDFSNLKPVISSILVDGLNLRYLNPYLRSGICFGILRIFK